MLLHWGKWAGLCCFTGTCSSSMPQPCLAFWTKPAGLQFSSVPSSLRGFEAGAVVFGSACLHLHTLRSPRSLPISHSAPPPSPSCRGACCVIPEGCWGICLGDSCQSGTPPPQRAVGATSATCLRDMCLGRGDCWLCQCLPISSHRGKTLRIAHSNSSGHFQVKDWILRSSAFI